MTIVYLSTSVLHFLNDAILIKTHCLSFPRLPKMSLGVLFKPFEFLAPKDFNYAFQSFDLEYT